MDSPRAVSFLHHGIICHLNYGQPSPNLTPAASHLYQRLAEDEKVR
jgi:hypothetical protein